MTAQNNAAPAILFVDDEATTVKYFKQAMEQVAPVVTACSVEEGKRILDQHAQSLAVLVSDQRMPGGYGNELLHYARLHYPHMVRILTTAYSELEHTVEAVNQGQIHRYIQKPWEVSTLRMEMKQALELATLRKEHAELLNEKMAVRQQQTLANRIGALYLLCSSLCVKDDFRPLETYLAAAATARAKPHEPDWQTMDYADLVDAEARWSGGFGRDVGNRLADIRQAHAGWQAADGVGPLADVLEGWAQAGEDGSIVFTQAVSLAEFLEASPDAPVSGPHVAWLALLIWLREKGCSLQLAQTDRGMQGRLEPAAAPLSSVHLADWVRRFCEV